MIKLTGVKFLMNFPRISREFPKNFSRISREILENFSILEKFEKGLSRETLIPKAKIKAHAAILSIVV